MDYAKMADTYLEQVKLLEEKIKKRRAIKYFSSVEAREQNENALLILYEMRRDALVTYRILKSRAEQER